MPVSQEKSSEIEKTAIRGARTGINFLHGHVVNKIRPPAANREPRGGVMKSVIYSR
jgi:hypothetical protein